MFSFSSKQQRAFSLIELIVVIAIIGIISVVVVIGFGDYGKKVDNETVINSLLLDFRTVQTWSTNARSFPKADGSDDFDAGFGIHLEKDSGEYVVFGDRIGNYKYDFITGGVANVPDECSFANTTGECIEEKTFEKGFIVDKICSDADGNDCYDSVDVVFKRPNLGPTITTNNVTQSRIEVIIKNGAEVEKTIVVSSTGQIHIKK